MFGKRKQKPQALICALGTDGVTLVTAPVAEFPIPRQVTVALSIEYFDDPEPCEIHSAAVRWRALHEIEELCAGGERKLEDLPSNLQGLFPEGTRTVRVTEAIS